MAAEIKNVEKESQETDIAIKEIGEDVDSVWNKKKEVDAQTDKLNAKSDAQQDEIRKKEKQADATKKKADEIIEDKLMRL